MIPDLLRPNASEDWSEKTDAVATLRHCAGRLVARALEVERFDVALVAVRQGRLEFWFGFEDNATLQLAARALVAQPEVDAVAFSGTAEVSGAQPPCRGFGVAAYWRSGQALTWLQRYELVGDVGRWCGPAEVRIARGGPVFRETSSAVPLPKEPGMAS